MSEPATAECLDIGTTGTTETTQTALRINTYEGATVLEEVTYSLTSGREVKVRQFRLSEIRES